MCPEKRKKNELTLQVKDLVLQFLVYIWDAISEVRLAMNLE